MTSRQVAPKHTADDTGADQRRLDRIVAWLLGIGGLVGLAASFVLTIEKLELLINPNYIPTCTFNAALSCGTVMKSEQAALFGFPNSLLGIAGFSAVTAIGLGLLAGATYRRWFWLGLQAGATLGVIFTHWLIIESLYEIRTLCPYCMVVWAVTIPIFVYVTLSNLERGHFGGRDGDRAVTGYHGILAFTWLAVIAALVFTAFGASLFA
ncbi:MULTISPECIES: vitamin K epoxide reductase family protein [unclassified Crossiella]|uniref:vitamin K epoxide reductase family protein n=1 Tax=unclassified Crossiella TaxID=2620835 RepID=UPI001FFF6401|nr:MULTISPECIES: vitamin K epoxide reductase family protein [unclassified Crossiella]MCK2240598.1 vitamin K epoxide reductase family protein [Crossiella sp. S99.2]MCK2252951.1 vitamin K epoxide reductase family protein [Crossiella sp. S99.1]